MTERARRPAPQEPEARKQRVLTQDKPSVTRSIAEAVVIKDGNLSFLADRDGQIPMDHEHGLGLYHHDCRYLNGYECTVADRSLRPLAATAVEGFEAVFQFTTPDLEIDDRVIPSETIGIRWVRVVESRDLALCERISITNFGREPVEVPITLTYRAEFEDVFLVRGLVDEQPGGEVRPPTWDRGRLCFSYRGADGVERRTEVDLTPRPEAVDGSTARYRVRLGPRECRDLRVVIRVAESVDADPPRSSLLPADLNRLERQMRASADERVSLYPSVRTDSIALNHVLDRSLRDLGVLRSHRRDRWFFAAGVPWFVALFGRDSIITALQTLAFDHRAAEQTLRLLALYQGERLDDWRDEQPGKILHELRVGELARLDEIPHTPYYGAVDATPLFLILLARHASWTGSLSLFHDLRDHVERALDWIAEYADSNDDGYVDYHSGSERGLINQGWKDSGHAIVNADGSLAEPPIALVEVQAYVYEAKRAIASLYRRAGDRQRAERLEREAAELRDRFNRDFWDSEMGTYVLALQRDGRPARVATSNAGHALWAEIAEPDKARRTRDRLLADDMFSGWGVRTLSDRELRYNPIGYHLGTVWPHDNSIVAAGLRRYGFDEAALRIFEGIASAANLFSNRRLPEAFAGFARNKFGVPVHFPVACHPQAWSAGAVPYLLQTMLGLVPEAFDRRLRIRRPLFPDFLHFVEIRGLRVADARVDLRFDRTAHGVSVETLELEGDLEVRQDG